MDTQTLFIAIGLLWFFACFMIGLFTSNKNKFGPDAVQNYCDQNDDNLNMIFWFSTGIIVFIALIIVGVNL